MTENEIYLQGLLKEIATLKTANKRALYRTKAKIPDSVATYVKKHLELAGYDIRITKCVTCSQSWDITIHF
jgi:hypothetical protein